MVFLWGSNELVYEFYLLQELAKCMPSCPRSGQAPPIQSCTAAGLAVVMMCLLLIVNGTDE